MGVYVDMLGALAQEAEAALWIPATRDPALVSGLVASGRGCIYVQFPVHVQRLLTGPNLQVPVSLVAPVPADLTSIDWLLEHFDAFVEFCGARSVVNGPIDVGSNTFPAVTATVQVAP